MMNMANRKHGGFGFSPSLTGPGTIFTLAFIALSVGMGLLFSRGVAPKSTLTDLPDSDTEVELVIETPIPGQKGLQLKTLKFKECGSSVTIDLMLDTSGSMGDRTPSGQTKISRLREAVGELISNAKDTSIIGIQAFSTGNIREEVPVSYFKDVKGMITGRINSLSPGSTTPTHDALAFSRDVLKTAIPKFPTDRKFNFIFVSDGQPVPDSQDPRLFTPNPADEIKALGVTVYTLGIFDSGQQSNPKLSDLMKSIATSPDNYYAASNADETKKLLAQISNRIKLGHVLKL
jgi:hypothetical protein